MWQWGRWPIEEADVNAIPLTLDTPQYTHTINTLQVMLTEYRVHQMYYSHVMFTHNPIYTLTEGTYLPVNNTKQPPLGEKGR